MRLSTPVAPPDPELSPRDDPRTLVHAARAGERGAFARLYARFAPVVHGIALARVDRDDAEDVVQEVFTRVHRTLATLRDDAAFPAWICTLARNAAADTLRRRRRTPAPEPFPEPPARDAARDDDELRAHVLAAVRTLPDAYRETLLLRLVEGLTGPEIAARTGLTHGSVRVNLSRGMARLRERLAAEDLA